MEYLDIRDKNGNPTGVIKERSLVHADGDLHGTSHVWIVKKNEKGSYDLLLQKRSENKMPFQDVMTFLPQAFAGRTGLSYLSIKRA